MLNGRALLVAASAGTVAQVAMVVAGHMFPPVKAMFAIGGMGISLLAGLAYGLVATRDSAAGAGALALGGLVAGAVCAFPGILVSYLLSDVPATLLVLGTVSSAVTGAIGGLVADGARLGQVLANLVGNAVKFTPPNGVIRVRVVQSDAVAGVAGITVWNSGEGIPEDDLERIFERFEQARTERTRQAPGTGLGLSISRGLVEAHGGAAWAESRPGEGVRFAVVLPVDPVAEKHGRPVP